VIVYPRVPVPRGFMTWLDAECYENSYAPPGLIITIPAIAPWAGTLVIATFETWGALGAYNLADAYRPARPCARASGRARSRRRSGGPRSPGA
jgi:hypothetical protein